MNILQLYKSRKRGYTMYYTIHTNWYRNWRRYWKQARNHANIVLPNGMKCNYDFFWLAVKLGSISEED